MSDSGDVVQIQVHRDGYTKLLQVCIELKDRHGYRILGPKYLGKSELLAATTLNARDAAEIRSYLDKVQP